MSPWNWPGLDYIVKFNFMYLTDVCDTAAEKDAIIAHLHGLWDHFRPGRDAVQGALGQDQLHGPGLRARLILSWESFRPFIRPLFINQYLAERLPPAR